MGRGRAKAKQTKVARDLKYRTHQTDFSALAQELHSGPDRPPASSDDNLDDELDDEWSDYQDPSYRD
jgi:Protein of unknown function (DUF3073)